MADELSAPLMRKTERGRRARAQRLGKWRWPVARFALGAIVNHASASEWPADDRRVSYEGRYAVGAQHEVRLGFPGIAVRVRVSATSLRVKIHASSDDVYFAVTLDARDTRTVLGITLSAVHSNVVEGRPGFGVFRM